MFLALFFAALLISHQVASESTTAPSPLFEFWNPLTWMNPKFSSQTMFQILRATGESREKTYEHLKKALLPANHFFGNVREQFEAWDNEPKKDEKSKGSRRPNKKKPKMTT